jgi:ribosome-associated toxin RatA of RatAB toxin-antitoxin module
LKGEEKQPMPVVENSVWVDAPVETVMAVAKDYEAYPSFMKDVKSITILEQDGTRTLAKWVARVEEVKMDIKWTQEDTWDETATRSHFRQTSGDYEKLEGDWVFTPERGGTRFDSTVDVEFNIPLIGPLLKGLIAKKVKENLDETQSAIKRRAEDVKGNAEP